MNIEQTRITLFLNKVKGFLLLKTPTDVTHNLLSMLGLYTIDFPDHNAVDVSYDEDGIYVLAKPFGTKCTCANEKEELKFHLEHTGHGIRHTTSCDYYRREKILYHGLLREFDTTDPVVSVYDFDWPSNIEPYRAAIITKFPEQDNDGLWKAFAKTWSDIMELLPQDDAIVENPEPDVKTGYEDAAPATSNCDYSDADEDLHLGPRQPDGDQDEPAAQGMPDPVDDYDCDIPVPTAAAALVEKLEPITVPVPVNPASQSTPATQSEVPVPKKRGRKPGSTNAAKAIREAESSELRPEDFTATPAPTGEGQVIPACTFYAKMMREELSRLSGVMDDIEVASTIPVENLKMVKDSLDRLALRSAHMELRGVSEDGERRVNMLIETTVSNVLETTRTATRDLALAPDDPRTWESFRKLLGDVSDKAKAMLELMTQPGAGPAIYSVGASSEPSDE